MAQDNPHKCLGGRVSFKTLKILLSNSPRGRELQSKDWQNGLGKLVGQASGRAAAGGGEERKVFKGEEQVDSCSCSLS